MNNLLINNDLDLYYELSLNNNKFKEIRDNRYADMVDIDDIENYEKLLELVFDVDEPEETKKKSNDVSNTNGSDYGSDEDDYCEDDNILTMNIKKYNNKQNKKKTKKIYCTECDGEDVIEDSTQGIIVCTNCGTVISNLIDMGAEWTHFNDDDKKDMTRCSHPISLLLPQSSIATTIGGSCSSRIKTLHGWSAMPYKERSLNDVFKIIQKKCHQGKMLKCIEDDAKITYKNISDCKHLTGKSMGKSIIIRGKNRMSVIAACVLNSCRKKDKTRSPKEIAELFDLKYPELTKGHKIFQKLAKLKHINLKHNLSKPEHFITRFCEESKIKGEYLVQALKISANAQKLQIASVHTPLSLATGSIYSMIYLNDLDINKKIIADKFTVSQVTIIKAFKKLEPFLNLLMDDEKCDRLKVEIKKYQNHIEIKDEIKSKFIRFNIDIEKAMETDNIQVYSIYDGNLINDKLIVDHNLEINDKMIQIDNEYTKLTLNFTNDQFTNL